MLKLTIASEPCSSREVGNRISRTETSISFAISKKNNIHDRFQFDDIRGRVVSDVGTSSHEGEKERAWVGDKLQIHYRGKFSKWRTSACKISEIDHVHLR